MELSAAAAWRRNRMERPMRSTIAIAVVSIVVAATLPAAAQQPPPPTPPAPSVQPAPPAQAPPPAQVPPPVQPALPAQRLALGLCGSAVRTVAGRSQLGGHVLIKFLMSLVWDQVDELIISLVEV